MSDRSNTRREERTVGALLRGGLVVSSLLMAAGLGWALASGRIQSHPVSFRSIRHFLAGGHPSGLMALGLFVLVALPVARVLALAVDFARERDWRFLIVALTVFGLLVVAVFVGHP
jgi:uncharacterized membrane protein